MRNERPATYDQQLVRWALLTACIVMCALLLLPAASVPGESAGQTNANRLPARNARPTPTPTPTPQPNGRPPAARPSNAPPQPNANRLPIRTGNNGNAQSNANTSANANTSRAPVRPVRPSQPDTTGASNANAHRDANTSTTRRSDGGNSN